MPYVTAQLSAGPEDVVRPSVWVGGTMVARLQLLDDRREPAIASGVEFLFRRPDGTEITVPGTPSEDSAVPAYWLGQLEIDVAGAWAVRGRSTTPYRLLDWVSFDAVVGPTEAAPPGAGLWLQQDGAPQVTLQGALLSAARIDLLPDAGDDPTGMALPGIAADGSSVKLPVSVLRADAQAAAQEAVQPGVKVAPLTDGKVPIPYLPTGTESGTVAAGDDPRIGYATPQQFPGFHGDTQRATLALTATAGSNTLSASSAVFGPDDVGKFILITGAGETQTTGGITAVAVSDPGEGFQAVPDATATGGSGSGAVLSVLLGVKSATVESGGSGGTDGTYTFKALSGVGQAAQFSGVVSGGALTSITAIINPGAYADLPQNTTSVALDSTAGFTVLPRVTVVWKVVDILAVSSGTGYPVSGTTAALSGGNPTTPATIGTVTVAPEILPLSTTITAVSQDGKSVTLAVPVRTAISNTSRPVTWGHDDAPAINAALAQQAEMGGMVFFPPLPSGRNYGAATRIELPPLGKVTLRAGGVRTTVMALRTMNELLYKDETPAYLGTQIIEGLTFDGSGAVYAPGNCRAFNGRFFNVMFNNALKGNNLIAGGGQYATLDTDRVTGSNSPEFYPSPAQLPEYCHKIGTSDGSINGLVGSNARIANIYDWNYGNNHYTNAHGFGYGYGSSNFYNFYAQYCILVEGKARFTGVYADGASIAGVGIRNADVTVFGGICQWPASNGRPTVGKAVGVQLGRFALRGCVIGVDALDPPAPRKVVQVGSGSTTTTVLGNPGASYTSLGFALVRSPQDGTDAHGAARGADATDLQATRDLASQIAAGARSAILAGQKNTVEVAGENAVVCGDSVLVGGPSAFATGRLGVIRGAYGFGHGGSYDDRGDRCTEVFAQGSFTRTGDAQVRKFLLRRYLTGGATRLTTDGGETATASNGITMPPPGRKAIYDGIARNTVWRPATNDYAVLEVRDLVVLQDADGTFRIDGEPTVERIRLSADAASVSPAIGLTIGTDPALRQITFSSTGPAGWQSSLEVSLRERTD